MRDDPDQRLVSIRLVWPGPDRGRLGEVSFVVEYEGAEGPGRVLLSPEAFEALNIAAVYRTGQRIPLPLNGVPLNGLPQGPLNGPVDGLGGSS